MFIPMCLADDSTVRCLQGTEAQKVKGLTEIKMGGETKYLYSQFNSSVQ